MSPEVSSRLLRESVIYNEMERIKKEDPEDFKELLEMAGGDYGLATAFQYGLVEQDLEERGIIKKAIYERIIKNE